MQAEQSLHDEMPTIMAEYRRDEVKGSNGNEGLSNTVVEQHNNRVDEAQETQACQQHDELV